MARKSKPEGKKYSYMDTYGDLVTLLLCFFVLLFSMSSIEEEKFNSLVEGLNGSFGSQQINIEFRPTSSVISGQGPDDPTGTNVTPSQDLPMDLSAMAQALEEFIEENSLSESISVSSDESGAIFIRLSGDLLFPGDDASLREPLRNFLNFLTESLNEVDDQVLQVRFLGHTATDSTSPKNDWLLSAQRAGEVSNYVTSKGFSRYKVQPQFYGKNYPVADNATAAGKALNRRVDIVILSNNPDTMLETLQDAMRVYFPDDDMQYFTGEPEELPEDSMRETGPTPGDENAAISIPKLPDSTETNTESEISTS